MVGPVESPTPRVLVVGLGGTIAMGAGTSSGVVPSLSPDQLLAAVPGLAASGIAVETEDVRNLPGAYLTFADLDEVVALVARRLAAGIDGVVVTQGTDTIEESAYYLDLLHSRPEPVVVTGAMRNPTLAGADGPANLLAAVQVAASPAARDRGCLVVFADEVHAAGRVRKTHSTSVGTFRSPDGGALGYVAEGRVRFVNDATGRVTAPPRAGDSPAPRVGLVTVTLGDDPTLLDGLAERYDGVVVAGFGAGHVPESLVEPLDALAAQVPVVLASRTGSGPSLAATYAFAGSESDLLSRGLVSAGWLHPYKARVLLHVLLAGGLGGSEIAATFAEAGGRGQPATMRQ